MQQTGTPAYDPNTSGGMNSQNAAGATMTSGVADSQEQ